MLGLLEGEDGSFRIQFTIYKCCQVLDTILLVFEYIVPLRMRLSLLMRVKASVCLAF
jgi:hypothetical protein